jgi:hypothetical protein
MNTWQHLDHRQIGGRNVVFHWPATTERYCVDSGRAVRMIPGDRCLRHGSRDEMCTTAVRAPARCMHEHLSPNHPHPHCSECGQDAEDVTAEFEEQP